MKWNIQLQKLFKPVWLGQLTLKTEMEMMRDKLVAC